MLARKKPRKGGSDREGAGRGRAIGVIVGSGGVAAAAQLRSGIERGGMGAVARGTLGQKGEARRHGEGVKISGKREVESWRWRIRCMVGTGCPGAGGGRSEEDKG